MQPSAEIVRVECAKCRRECDLSPARATLCGDRACRVNEMQARVRFVRCAHNPLQRSRVSSARNAGESAICPVCAQPSAEIVRQGAKCRRECDSSHVRATLYGDRACRVCEMQARVRFVSTCPTRAQSDESWRRRSTTLVGGVVGYLGSWKMRTGDLVVQLECTEYLGSWKRRTGDFLVQL